MKNKQFTNYKTAQELMKLGIPTDTADMVYKFDACFLQEHKPYLDSLKDEQRIRDMFIKGMSKKGATEDWLKRFKPLQPCWSLAGLLDVLPRNLLDKDGTIRVRQIIGDDVSYAGLGMVWNSQPTLLLNVVDAIKTLITEGYSLEDATPKPSEE